MRPPTITDRGRAVAANALDAVLELSVVGSFSRVGFLARRATQDWPDPPRMDGRTALVTGASSGIGRAIAEGLAERGADLVLGGRDADRLAEVARAVRARGVNARTWRVDLRDGAAIDDAARRLADDLERLDVIVHSAGALLAHYATDVDGLEATVATHVVAPFRLTWLMRERLAESGAATIVTVSSGGMYTQSLNLDTLEMSPDRYRGVTAYARAKRAQVTLAHEWSRRWAAVGVRSYVMHPGWANTPGLTESLPRFSRLERLWRQPAEGADTAVWLASGVAGTRGTRNGIWLDRRLRPEHRLPWTRWRHAPSGDDLWAWCAARSGLPEE